MSCKRPREFIGPTDELGFAAVEEQRYFVSACRIDTPVGEVEYYRHDGILHKVPRDLVKGDIPIAQAQLGD